MVYSTVAGRLPRPENKRSNGGCWQDARKVRVWNSGERRAVPRLRALAKEAVLGAGSARKRN